MAPSRLVFAAMLLFVAGCAPARGTIGAVLGQNREGRLYLREVPRGLAADKGGLRPDDEILLIDGRDVRVLDDAELHRVLSGDVGGRVKLTAVRGDDVIRVTLSRTPARPRASAAAESP